MGENRNSAMLVTPLPHTHGRIYSNWEVIIKSWKAKLNYILGVASKKKMIFAFSFRLHPLNGCFLNQRPTEN